MTIASWCSAAAAGLAALAAIVSGLDGDTQGLAFYAGASAVAVIQGWGARLPCDRHRLLVVGIGIVWLYVAALIDLRIIVFRGSGGVDPAPIAKATYLGLTATSYQALALHAGAILAILSALLGPRRPHRTSAQ
jgi:hypothetical protein